MAKKGLDISSMQAVLKDVKETWGWSLCIGAGASIPASPNWISLVEKLIDNHCESDERIDIETFKTVGLSTDAMIQAVRNKLKVTDEEFVHLLSQEVYAPIKEVSTDDEWKAFIRIHETNNLSGIKTEEWNCFKKVIDKLLINTSANQIAQVINEANLKGYSPKSILTFNGEAILLALLNYYYWMSKRKDNKNRYDRITNGMIIRHVNRIPFIHCHGVLPINGSKRRKGMNSIDKLVFAEENYLQLAYTPISWQAVTFIDNCMNSKMVFIGVSMSDVNMRRWLGFIHSNKMNEFIVNGVDCNEATEHFWINKKPNTIIEQRWIEESVSHLGVRLVWIDDWNQVGIALRKMLGL